VTSPATAIDLLPHDVLIKQMVVGAVVGGWLSGLIICGRCVGCGACGLQFLTSTVLVSLSLSLSVRIWKGLLCYVRHCVRNATVGWCLVMVLDAMATLQGAATATLGGVAGTTLGNVGLGGGALGWSDIMVVS
jgi:hypothetical protein